METVFLIVIVILALAMALKLIEYLILGITQFMDKKTNKVASLPKGLPVTYTTGWWPNQDLITISNFEVSIVESNLNLFNSQSVISYTIKGDVIFDGWDYQVKEIHISERINSDKSIECDRIIEITPIVGYENELKGKQGINPFKISKQHLVHSSHWGVNRILFVCGVHQQMVELQQLK